MPFKNDYLTTVGITRCTYMCNWEAARRVCGLYEAPRRVSHIKVESLAWVAFDLRTNQLGVRHFSRFLRSGPRCCRYKARFRFSAGHFSKARSGAPGFNRKVQRRFADFELRSAVEATPRSKAGPPVLLLIHPQAEVC